MKRWGFEPQAIGVALLVNAGFLIGSAYAGDDVTKCRLETLRWTPIVRQPEPLIKV
jgi:hypothetical protein